MLIHFYPTEGHVLFIEKDYNEFKMLSNKQVVEGILIEKAVKRNIKLF